MHPYSKTEIIPKPVSWLGDSRKAVKDFSEAGKHRAGIELFAVQLGRDPTDSKAMPSIGAGASEIRVHSEKEYRVIYVAKFEEAVYVLHAFTKKTRATRLRDVRVAQQRYREMIARRGRN